MKEKISVENKAEEKNFFDKLKTRWGVESIWQVVAILLVFTLTGSTVVYLKKHLYVLLGYDESTSTGLKFFTWIVFVFPCYQVLILVYGWLFGQFGFFWTKQKKMVERMKGMFSKNKKSV